MCLRPTLDGHMGGVGWRVRYAGGKEEFTSEGHWLGPVSGCEASGSSSPTSRPKYSPSLESANAFIYKRGLVG